METVRRESQTRPAALSALTLLIFFISSGSGTTVINEVELNPAGDDNSPNVLEWVELYNTGNEDVDISSWTLVAAHGDKEIVRIPSGSTIEAKRSMPTTAEMQFYRTLTQYQLRYPGIVSLTSGLHIPLMKVSNGS